MRVLVLGDGDCSFSASLLAALRQISVDVPSTSHHELVATCFDSKQDVLLKYPFSTKVLRTLETPLLSSPSGSTVEGKILFKVNATASLASLMSRKGEDEQQQHGFDHVVFNFPHVGVEDCQLHTALLKHILYRVKEILENDGCLYISLADGQATSWRLYDTATQMGLQVVQEISFRQEAWPGYETRRHQSGKSFNSRVVSNICYVLRRQGYCYDENKDIFTSAMTTHKISSSLPGTEIDGTDKKKTIIPGDEKNRKGVISVSKKSKKRRIVEDTKHLIEIVSESSCLYKCKKCHKAFNNLRGVQTHIYQIHLLDDIVNDSNDKDGVVGVRTLCCNECEGREFPNEDALMQHLRSKHSPLSQSTAKVPLLSSIYTGSFHCNICGMGFNTEQECEDHLTNGIVPSSIEEVTNTKQMCKICGRYFKDERGLYQHSMSCTSTS